jgi:peptidoglycan/LPS O-acetylase OafA/YrhL
MKKSIAMLSIAVLLLTGLVLWYFLPEKEFAGMDNIIALAVLIMVISFIIEGVKNFKEEKNQLPVDDERSKKAEYRAGYYSYLISVYIWVTFYFLRDFFTQVEYLLATGILCMAAVFIIARFIFRSKGDV